MKNEYDDNKDVRKDIYFKTAQPTDVKHILIESCTQLPILWDIK